MNAPKEKKFNGEVYLLVDAGYAYKLKAKRDAIYLIGSPPAGFQADQPKQPWEMTSDEFAIYQLTEVNGFEKRGDKWYRPDAEGKYQEATAWAERMLKEHKGGHKYSVEKALAEGKTVPPEVLADYPELALKNILISLRPGQVSKPPIYNTNRKG